VTRCTAHTDARGVTSHIGCDPCPVHPAPVWRVTADVAYLPCISCEGPSDHRTPDGYPVCSDCHDGGAS
jgi:hypothetical protein